MTTLADISERADEELKTAALRIRSPIIATRLWERVLTPSDRTRLGDDLDQAYRHHGTVGMWMELRGVSRQRAIIDVAKKLSLMDEETSQWLLREIGDLSDDPEEAIAAVVGAGGLVLVESPREAYWEGEKIEVDWYKHPALWNYFWELVVNSKAGRSIDSFTFLDRPKGTNVINQKSRLKKMPGFPKSLADQIESPGCGTQKLKLSPEQIRLFQIESNEILREFTP